MAKLNKPTYSFEKSLKKGKQAENMFLEYFGDKIEKLDGFMSDFRIIATGETIELKTDFYCPTKTENLFIERYSYGEVDGGPRQSLQKGSKYWVYWFPKANLFYCFKTARLVNLLEKIEQNYKLIPVFNLTHTTRGYKIPRAELEKIAIPLEEILQIK
jgi:hypothetical protein